jgi:hypothetical protein
MLQFFVEEDPRSGAFLTIDPGWKSSGAGSRIKSRIRYTDFSNMFTPLSAENGLGSSSSEGSKTIRRSY